MYNIELVYYNSSIHVKFYKNDILNKDDKIAEFGIDEVEKKYNDKIIECKQIDFDDFLSDEEYKKSESQRVSFTRTKNSIYHIARSASWDWFLTLTLSPDVVDRYNLDECSKKLRKHLNNIKVRKCPDMYYLIVPEQHKDGAWHFHGLIGGCNDLNFADSGILCDDKSIYNWLDYKLGFTTATRVQDTARVSSYICKYITKDLCGITVGRQRYFVSKNCPRAEVYVSSLNWRYKQKLFEWLCENSNYIKKNTNAYNEIYYFECEYFPDKLEIEEYIQPAVNNAYEQLCDEWKLFDMGFKKCPLEWSDI